MKLLGCFLVSDPFSKLGGIWVVLTIQEVVWPKLLLLVVCDGCRFVAKASAVGTHKLCGSSAWDSSLLLPNWLFDPLMHRYLSFSVRIKSLSDLKIVHTLGDETNVLVHTVVRLWISLGFIWVQFLLNVSPIAVMLKIVNLTSRMTFNLVQSVLSRHFTDRRVSRDVPLTNRSVHALWLVESLVLTYH